MNLHRSHSNSPRHRAASHRFLARLLVLSTLCGVAAAAPFTAKDDGHQVAMEGNSRGATGCVACHGEDGAGLAVAGFPRLAGLSETYLIAQLRAFRAGTRPNPDMQRIASALNESELEMVAAYYAGLPPAENAPAAKTAEPVPETQRQLGARLLYVGKWESGVPACVRCHGADAQGVPPLFPRLAGQHANYLKQQLQDWREDKRLNDPIGLMVQVAKGLDEADIDAISRYLAELPPAPPRAAGEERARRAPNPAGDHQDADLLHDVARWMSSTDTGLHQPSERELSDDEFSRLVLHGKRVFTETQTYAAQYVGNGLNCVNCHLDRGRRAESAPMGPAYVKYPKYRAKNHKVNTIEERIQGCFTYSENGTPPEPLSETMKGLVTYFYFLSKGIPSGMNLDAAGFPTIAAPPQPYDPRRGAQVFAENCAICHGANGEGTRLGDHYQFPPLWGDASFNWGAGMHRINTAAAFIRGNMPLANPGKLNLQQAWDVAAYINSHARPQDPRFNGDPKATRAQFHDHACYYGEAVWAEKSR